MWSVYILKCSDGTFYTGITTELERRVFEHNNSKLGAKYTRGRRPVELVFGSAVKNKSHAAKEEARIRKMDRQEKIRMINGNHCMVKNAET
jgi:putative endonuclease